MNARIIKLWQDLQASYYFIPSLMAIGAFILAFVASHIDKNLGFGLLKELGWFYSNSPDGVRAILSTIAGSMITVAGVTFSLTMVAVTSASAQFGPRLIGNFMRDRANQITLGTFTATFIYCLLILRVARTGDDGSGQQAISDFVPNLSVLVAIALAIASVGVLIYFVHHVPETLNVGNITTKVGRELRRGIQSRFPSRLGHEKRAPGQVDDLEDALEFDVKNAVKTGSAFAATEGYLQTINNDALIAYAEKYNCVVKLRCSPGDFCVRGDILADILEKTSRADGTDLSVKPPKLDDQAQRQLSHYFAVGPERTVHQNFLFLADELVEILARALSPGINDPFTAMMCMDWFRSALQTMSETPNPSPYRYNTDGELCVIARPVSYAELLSVFCDQSRAYIAADYIAAAHMLSILDKCLQHEQDHKKRELLEKQMQDLHAAASQCLPNSSDRDLLSQKYDDLRATKTQAAPHET